MQLATGANIKRFAVADGFGIELSSQCCKAFGCDKIITGPCTSRDGVPDKSECYYQISHFPAST